MLPLRALAAGAGAILADEPTGSLDTENARTIFALLKDLAQEQNVLVVVVTHDMSIAERADVVLCLADGQLTQSADCS